MPGGDGTSPAGQGPGIDKKIEKLRTVQEKKRKSLRLSRGVVHICLHCGSPINRK